MINKIRIDSFRMFNNLEFQLGKRITAIAGVNAIGKSTLLGIIGHLVESKEKNIFGKPFRTEFSEIFKTTRTNDPTGSHKGEIFFSAPNSFDEIHSTATFRSTWQKGSRFRIIPKRIDNSGNSSEAKYPMPVQYLGLSRLYPLGETTGNPIPDDISSLTDIEKTEIYANYREILSLSEKIKDISNIKADGYNSTFIGIETDKYDKFCNSAGQDNLGQILVTLKSFEHLKNAGLLNDGGLFLIDEIESTLHPNAQTKLLKFLFKQSKSIGLQIVFTTHSLNILKNISDIYQNESASNDYKTLYISKANGRPKLYNNPPYELIVNNLHTSITTPPQNNKVIIYSEDDTSRWFFRKIIHGYANKLKFIRANFGCNQLEKMLKEDSNYFSKVLILVDGDVKKSNPSFIRKNNVIALPSDTSPERVLYDYLNDESCEYWDRIDETHGFTRDFLLTHNGPFTNKYSSRETERKKLSAWFEDHKQHIEQNKVIEHWKDDNEDIVKKLRVEFIKKYNKIAEQLKINKLTIKE